MTHRPARRLGLLALGVLSLVLALVWAVPATAGPPSSSTVNLVVTSVQGVQVPAGTSSQPFVVKSVPFDVTVSFFDAGGAATVLPNGVSSLQLTDSLGDTLGMVDNISSTAQSVQFGGVAIGTAANGVTVQASVAKGSSKGTTSVPSDPFDVLVTFSSAPQDTPLAQIGGTNTSEGCTATPESPICADLLLPGGSDTGILMSLGLCDGLGKCVGSDAQALVKLSQYSRSSPATMIVKCDKTLCGGGGINKQQLAVEPSTGGGFSTAPPCPAKNTIGAGQQFCVDYVQSTRDNAGDTYLYLLLTDDVRAHYT